MRKWIFIGVFGGLLQFGAVGYIAFSGPDTTSKVPRAKSHVPAARAKPATGKTLAKAVQTWTHPMTAPAEAVAVPAPIGGEVAPPATEQQPQPGGNTAPAPAPPPASIPAPPAAASASPKAPPAPAPAAPAAPLPPRLAIPADLPLSSVEDVIREVFGKEGDKAVRVARCESELSTTAKNGVNQGLFQLGLNERAEYGNGEDALSQIKAAYELFKARGWQPWVCA